MKPVARRLRISGLLLVIAASAVSGLSGAEFEITLAPSLPATTLDGRLFVVLSRTNDPEPRLSLGKSGPDGPEAIAKDVHGVAKTSKIVLDSSCFAFPTSPFGEFEPGDYYVQALLDSSRDLRLRNGAGNLFSAVRRLHVNPGKRQRIRLQLDSVVPPERLPADTQELKFIKIESALLSRFHGRPISLRAGVVLPRDYDKEPAKRYPLWIRIGGLNARYTTVKRLMARDSEFRKTWEAEGTPRFILLQLDGAGPYGDPYQVNSDNNGPYGDALVQELIPFVEKQFRTIGGAKARVLSGTSTGGWVCLALQIFYPDFFNGAWASCPDPVDFHALELVDLYEETNAFINAFGFERPSERTLNGDTRLTMRTEVGLENLLGRRNSFTMSGEQWCAWNALFGPRGTDGCPAAICDPSTGKIDPTVARHWRRYDLCAFLKNNWRALAPKLAGKLHISAGEADQYFLNNAVHLLEQTLNELDPPFQGHITYGPGQGHGWSNLSLVQMLREMENATGRTP